VDPAELVFVGTLALLLLGIAAVTASRQWQALKSLRTRADLGPHERQFLHTQAWRRLLCSALLVLLAGLLLGTPAFEEPRLRMHQERQDQAAAGGDNGIRPEHRALIQDFSLYWLVIFLVVFLLLMVVVIDLWAIARFGMRLHRQLRQDLRAALADEVARLRRGHNGDTEHV
jgi:hypothetical protein